MTEKVEGEVVKDATDATAIAVRDNATLVALERAQIDMQITTARAYPRSIEAFKQTLEMEALIDEETAASMYYSVPRDGKVIQGESVRLAEIAGSAWEHTRYGSRVIEVGDEFLTARGMCWDLQRNVAIEIDVKRRIVNRHGKRFSVDMIQTTGMAACSIALRNAIFKVVPRAHIKPVLKRAMAVAAGDVKTLDVKRTAALEYFEKKHGVKPSQVYALLEIEGKADITTQHIVALLGIRTALNDKEATLAEFFPPQIDLKQSLINKASVGEGEQKTADAKADAKARKAAEKVVKKASEPEAEEPVTEEAASEAAGLFE